MPERFDSQELTEEVVGIYQHKSVPPSLSPRFFSILHNLQLDGGLIHVRQSLRRLNSNLAGDGTRTMYGYGVYRATTGDELLIASGSKLQNMPIGGGDVTDLTTSYPTGFRTSPTGARTVFITMGGQVFIVNGVDAPVKYNGTDLTRMGLVAPSTLSAPTLSAGSITGTRNYIATLVSDTAHKSSESAGTAALPVTYSAQQGSFTAPSVPSSDPQVDRWNLYATTTTSTATYFRVNSTPQTLATAIVDNLTDVALGARVSLDETAGAPPPGTLQLLTSHQGRLVGRTAEDPNTLIWSGLGFDTFSGTFLTPESWPADNRLPFEGQGGTKITGLISFFEWLVVFQDFGIWAIREVLADSTSRVISPLYVAPDGRGVGVSDIGNIAQAENKIYFAAKDGIYSIFRETITRDIPDLAIEKVTENIDDLYQQLDFNQGGAAIFDRDASRYIFIGQGGLVV